MRLLLLITSLPVNVLHTTLSSGVMSNQILLSNANLKFSEIIEWCQVEWTGVYTILRKLK